MFLIHGIVHNVHDSRLINSIQVLELTNGKQEMWNKIDEMLYEKINFEKPQHSE